jgi:hypothetical protein
VVSGEPATTKTIAELRNRVIAELKNDHSILQFGNSAITQSFSPGRLGNPGDLAPQRQSAETQAADAELAQVSARTSAQLAAVVLPGRELGFLQRLGSV